MISLITTTLSILFMFLLCLLCLSHLIGIWKREKEFDMHKQRGDFLMRVLHTKKQTLTVTCDGEEDIKYIVTAKKVEK